MLCIVKSQSQCQRVYACMNTQILSLFRCSAKELTLSITPECVGEMATLWQTDGFCGLLSDTTGVFASCIAALGPAYMENCEYDVCSQDNVDNAKDAACRSLAAFNLECSNIGLGADWRAVSGCGTHNGLRLSMSSSSLTSTIIGGA